MSSYQSDQFFAVLNGGHIKTVYQPIVSLKNGTILGYEALSRIKIAKCELNIEQLFCVATIEKKLWELEKLCRIETFKNAASKPFDTKLFINVDANIIHDPALKDGFTGDKLKEYGLNPDDIVFEITEKSAIHAMDDFTDALEHYQKQNFKIAIDDFGSGYSGLNRVCAFAPNYIKIDMELVRGINDDPMKKSAVCAVMIFCKEAGIEVIAEGIETEAELKTLIRLGVDYAQGFFLAYPTENFCEIEYDQKLFIKSQYLKNIATPYKSSILGKIDSICHIERVVLPSAKAVDVFKLMLADDDFTEACVCDDDNMVCGLLTRSHVFEHFATEPNSTLTVTDITPHTYLSTERNSTIGEVSISAMNRNTPSLYDSVIVTDNGQYFGVVTVRDLLTSIMDVQLKLSIDTSPLTGFSNNSSVQVALSKTISSKKKSAIIYLDLDNFRAYNNTYGAKSGDKMIKSVADSIVNCCADADFKGHVGGDDFIIITHDVSTLDTLCDNIIKSFAQATKALYSAEDLARGYISSQNLNGFVENFAVATLSIAVVTNQTTPFTTIDNLSKSINIVKKQCKAVRDNAVIIV